MIKAKLDITEHSGLKIGDLALTYNPGYHRITGFHTDQISPLEIQVDYYQILNDDGSPAPRRKGCCHISHCTPVTRTWVTEKRVTWHNAIDLKINKIYDALEISPAELQTTPKPRIRKSHKKIDK
jgi:hypothetical protein